MRIPADKPHADLDFEVVLAAIGNKMGTFDIPCLLCSPFRKKKLLRCLRVWRLEPDFLTFNCAHCDEHGFLHARGRTVPATRYRRLQAQASEHNVAHHQKQRRKARWLWARAELIGGTLAEKYLRSRGITCPLPDTLRFCSAGDQHPPAMISAFGIPSEPVPGQLNVTQTAISDLHITRLRADGLGKADTDNPKRTLAPSSGLPIVVAPVNDMGGLAIAEGIEDALSLHQATGLGAWAAGSAGRLPALARVVPRYVESVTISVDDDDAGLDNSHELATLLRRSRGRRFEINMLDAHLWRVAA